MNASFELPERLARVVADPRSYANWDALHEDLEDRPSRVSVRARADRRLQPVLGGVEIRRHPRHRARTTTCSRAAWAASCRTKRVAFETRAGIGGLFRSVVAMNEPDHRKYRLLTQAWFQPKNLQNVESRVRALARRYRRSTGSDGRGVRFRRRDRRAFSAAGDHVDSRRAGRRRTDDAAAHAGVFRQQGCGSQSRQGRVVAGSEFPGGATRHRGRNRIFRTDFGGAPAQSDRRSRVGHRQRGDRRQTDQRRRRDGLLHHGRVRRPRHDVVVARRRRVGVVRKPGSTRAAEARTRG